MNLIARIRVVLTSLVTWITVAVSTVTLLLPDILDLFGADTELAVVLTRGLAVLVGIVALIRKVTPVLDSAEGLLAADDVPFTSAEAHLQRELDALRTVVAEYASRT